MLERRESVEKRLWESNEKCRYDGDRTWKDLGRGVKIPLLH